METYFINNNTERFGFIVEINKDSSHALKFKIFQIHSLDGTTSIEIPIAEQKVEGSIKWDGCSDMVYGENGSIHFCDILDQITMNECLKFVWTQANIHLGDEDIPEWDAKYPIIVPLSTTYRIVPS